MAPVLVLVIVAVVVTLGVVAWNVSRQRRSDGVDSFRRQIDALSSEARRSTVDQIREQRREGRKDNDG